MDIQLNNEINGLQGDKKLSERELLNERNNYARRLKNGLGEDIINYLNNPPKPNKWNGFKIRFKRWWCDKFSK